MKATLTTALIVLQSLSIMIAFGQQYDPTQSLSNQEIHPTNDAEHPCIKEHEYEQLIQRCEQNKKTYHIPDQSLSHSKALNNLIWPMQAANGLNDCSFYRVSAYVDQDLNAGAIKDWNCGTKTYDGHKGTDISTWPFNFYKMDSDMVEVVAAASGVIIDKHDGEFDRNCSGNNLTANYVVLQHSDGSWALYWHMKSGKVTTKAIGANISAGEVIGVVGSSGSSSGPHLHFEVWAGNTQATRVDPFSGTCNSLNATTWWANQKNHKETGIVKASVHTTDIVLPACPATETLNETASFQIPFQGPNLPAGYGKFYIFIRDELAGMTAVMRIVNPNGSTFSTWNYASTADSPTRTMGWSKTLPVTPGIYTFEAIYNSMTCSSSFEITEALGLIENPDESSVNIFPNPSTGLVNFQLKEIWADQMIISDITGKIIERIDIEQSELSIDLSNKPGIYFYQLIDAKGIGHCGRISIQ